MHSELTYPSRRYLVASRKVELETLAMLVTDPGGMFHRVEDGALLDAEEEEEEEEEEDEEEEEENMGAVIPFR